MTNIYYTLKFEYQNQETGDVYRSQEHLYLYSLTQEYLEHCKENYSPAHYSEAIAQAQLFKGFDKLFVALDKLDTTSEVSTMLNDEYCLIILKEVI